MKFFFIAGAILGGTVLGCKVGNPDTTGAQLVGVKIFKNGQMCSSSGGSVDCTSKLVSTQSGPDNTCPNNDNSLHWWPIDSTSDCHGWQATDPFGKLHDNSANNIRCSADGLTLLYDQYAGTLSCNSGYPVSKTFTLNECHQGRPPVLWDKGRDFTCCGGKKDDSSTTTTTTSVVPAPAPAGTSTSVTVTTYMDAECLTTPEWKNSTFTMDTTAQCNELPDSSTNNVRCFDTYITYTNYPNTNDCSAATPRANRLEVGVCQYFPGPVPTWKKTAPDYNCRSEGPGDAAQSAGGSGGKGNMCCGDGSAVVNDGDHTTPPCADGSTPRACVGNSGSSKSEGKKGKEDDMLDDSDKKGDKKGGDDKKKGGMSGFRVADEVQGCGLPQFTIENAKFGGKCLDASNKRLALKACDGSAHQMFTMNAMGDAMMVMTGGEQCLQSSSLTKGPCLDGVAVSRNGAAHSFKMGKKCMSAKSNKALNLVKCNQKGKKQQWYVVPTFTSTAVAASSGFKLTTNGKKSKGGKNGGKKQQ